MGIGQLLTKGLILINATNPQALATIPQEEEGITFIFPHIHAEKKWDISNCGSLWTIFVANNLVEPLIRLDEHTQYTPAVAKSWFFSVDGKTLTLDISDKYRFHDGSPITPSAVLDSLRSHLKRQATAHSDIFKTLCRDGECNFVNTDGKRLVISLPERFNGFLYHLTTPELGVVPGNYVQEQEKDDKEALKKLSGPYKLTSFSQREVKLEAFELHPLVKKESPKRARILEMTDFSKAVAYAETHPAAIAVASDYQSGMELSHSKLQLFVSNPALTEFFLVNAKSKKLETIEQRRDVFTKMHATLSKVNINERIADKTSQIFPKGSPAFLSPSETKAIFSHPASKSKQRLQLKVVLFDWMKDAPIPWQMKNILVNEGIELEIKVTPIAQLADVLKGEGHDLIYIYTGVSAKDPIIEFIYLSQHPLTRLSSLSTNFSNLLETAKTGKNSSTYADLIRKMHKTLLEEYLILPTLHTKMIYGSGGKYGLLKINQFDGGLDIWNWKKN